MIYAHDTRNSRGSRRHWYSGRIYNDSGTLVVELAHTSRGIFEADTNPHRAELHTSSWLVF